MRSFVFYPEWLEYIQKLGDEDDQRDLLEIIVEYGCQGEFSNENAMMRAVFESLIKPRIDAAQEKYQGRIDGGKKSGRGKKVSEDSIEFLVKEGKKAKEIAETLGISADSVYHSAAWKARKFL